MYVCIYIYICYIYVIASSEFGRSVLFIIPPSLWMSLSLCVLLCIVMYIIICISWLLLVRH